MPETRRQKIEQMLADEPGDVFLRYSLAMEMRKDGEHEASIERLSALMADPTPYVPAFFMSAQQLVELDRIDEARRVLREGIEQAHQQNNAHAAGEMSELLTSLGSYGE